MPASGSNWFYNPNTSRGYRAAAWAVAIVGVVAWTYYEQKSSKGGKFGTEALEQWNKQIKSKVGPAAEAADKEKKK